MHVSRQTPLFRLLLSGALTWVALTNLLYLTEIAAFFGGMSLIRLAGLMALAVCASALAWSRIPSLAKANQP